MDIAQIRGTVDVDALVDRKVGVETGECWLKFVSRDDVDGQE